MVVWAFLPPTDVWSTIWTPIIIDPETSQACPPNLPQTVHKTCFSYQVVWGRVVDKVTASSPSPWRSYVYVWWHKKTHEQVWTCAEHAWKVRERIGHIQETSRRHVGVMWETCRNMLETIWEPYLTHTRTYKKLFNIVGKSRDCKSMVYSPSVQGHSFKSEFLVVHSWFMGLHDNLKGPTPYLGFQKGSYIALHNPLPGRIQFFCRLWFRASCVCITSLNTNLDCFHFSGMLLNVWGCFLVHVWRIVGRVFVTCLRQLWEDVESVLDIFREGLWRSTNLW